MCGIAGVWGEFNKDILRRMTVSIAHRGPDDHGVYESIDGKIALCHTRLSIIDLSNRAAQPMSDEASRTHIVFNGEIYNYNELRKMMELRDEKFRSDSDTEVILRLFLKKRTKVVDYLIGMFAFAILDERENALYIFRDRIGVKPLYYFQKGDIFIFASELKAIAQHPAFSKELDTAALLEYLRFGYISGEKTIYKHAHKLPPGCFMKVTAPDRISVERYWNPDAFAPQKMDEEDILQRLEDLFSSAFSYRLVSDVPVGIFLSGGIDSTLVAAILAKKHNISTFTIGFDDPAYDESPHAKKIAEHLGTKHTELRLTQDDAAGVLEKLPEIYDEPFADSSGIPTYIISKLARRHVKVALSADGGDELFCGYSRYQAVKLAVERFSKIPSVVRLLSANAIEMLPDEVVETLLELLKPGVKGSAASKKRRLVQLMRKQGAIETYQKIVSEWTDEELSKLLAISPPSSILHFPSSSDILHSVMLFDLKHYLPDDLLVKVDRASMAVSLEAREPMLDHRLVEYALTIPSKLKLRRGQTKYVVRKILKKYVPEKLWDRPKQGFSIPYAKWFSGDLNKEIKSAIADLARWEIFNGEYLRQIENSQKYSLWTLYVLSRWKAKWG